MALMYGQRLDVNQLAILAGTNRQGARLDRLRDAAHSLGFKASCGRVKSEVLQSVPLPAIAHLHRSAGDHYVVLLKVKDEQIVYLDPTLGKIEVPLLVFLREFSGFALLLTPNDNFALQCAGYRGRTPFTIIAAVLRVSRKRFSLALIFAVASMTGGLFAPFFLRSLVDLGGTTNGGHLPWIVRSASVLFVLVAFGRAVATLAKQLYVASLGSHIEREFLSGFLSLLPDLPLSTFDRHPPADLIARVNDAVVLRSAIAGPVLGLALDVASVFISVVVLSTISLPLSAIAICTALGSYGVYVWIRPSSVLNGRMMRAAMTELSGHVLEAVNGARLIKTFSLENQIRDQISEQHLTALRFFRKANLLSGVSSACALLINGMGIAFMVIVARTLIAAHRLTPGALIYAVAVSSMLMMSSETIASSIASIEDATVSAERLMHTEPREGGYEQTSNATVAEAKTALRLRHVAFGYDAGEPVLRDVSFQISPGQIVGIRGPSGCGKSTIAMLCNGLYAPSRGSIEVFGQSVDQWNVSELRKTVSVIYSDGNLAAGSLRYNLTLGRTDIDEGDVRRASELAFLWDFAISLPHGLDYRLGPLGYGLSSGQRQRVALARAFLLRPPILILDEATSNLDVDMERELLQNLIRERKKLTTLVISHRPETLRHVSRIYEVTDGIISLQDASSAYDLMSV